MKRYFFLIALLILIACKDTKKEKKESFITQFELSNGTETPVYQEVIDYYIELAREFPSINIQTMGQTDSGYPLHIVTYNAAGDFNFSKLRDQNTIILINNAIHPGESDGVDATMLLFRDLAKGTVNAPKQTVLVTIPIYNIGGALNRNTTTRANQNGPVAYGFRGNARNYDLNRDFIKNDTQNARSFAEIFHLVQPDIFIDNHVSNGADYQYTLTHLFTQHNKLGGNLGGYLHTQLMPKLEADLAKKEWDITPYVNVYNRVPESGFSQFMDSPRYSTGYTSLWNTLGMMVETHMLKPYKQRVEGTYEIMKSMVSIADKDYDSIKNLRKEAFEAFQNSKTYALNWGIDTTQTTVLQFKGFEADTITSDVTGLPRLKYNTDRPFIKEVVYQNYFKAVNEVEIPEAYIIPQAWSEVIQLMKYNNIAMKTMVNDTLIWVEKYRITDYKTRPSAYEGHYLHYNTKVISALDSIAFRKGDIMVKTNQPGIRYLLETLEPEAPDSFFNWNFFDTILQRKENFSPYVFEDIAKQMLDSDPELKEAFEAKKLADPDFSSNAYAQLNWLYEHSAHYEKAHMNYPVYRVPKPTNNP
ncbi:M14 family metallopeptidase [Leptobacterium sp. I13]|uniref:M14 family metallopeptidase n=1 Tax=Leptobacterium meishanense TaxID=3128904 RepID=UPI0030EC924C